MALFLAENEGMGIYRIPYRYGVRVDCTYLQRGPAIKDTIRGGGPGVDLPFDALCIQSRPDELMVLVLVSIRAGGDPDIALTLFL